MAGDRIGLLWAGASNPSYIWILPFILGTQGGIYHMFSLQKTRLIWKVMVTKLSRALHPNLSLWHHTGCIGTSPMCLLFPWSCCVKLCPLVIDIPATGFVNLVHCIQKKYTKNQLPKFMLTWHGRWHDSSHILSPGLYGLTYSTLMLPMEHPDSST